LKSPPQAYAVSGHRAEARKSLQDLEQLAKRRYVSSYSRALIWAGLREKDRAMECLQRAFDERSSWSVKLKSIRDLTRRMETHVSPIWCVERILRGRAL